MGRGGREGRGLKYAFSRGGYTDFHLVGISFICFGWCSRTFLASRQPLSALRCGVSRHGHFLPTMVLFFTLGIHLTSLLWHLPCLTAWELASWLLTFSVCVSFSCNRNSSPLTLLSIWYWELAYRAPMKSFSALNLESLKPERSNGSVPEPSGLLMFEIWFVYTFSRRVQRTEERILSVVQYLHSV